MSRVMALDLGSRGFGWAWEGRCGQVYLDRGLSGLELPERHFCLCDRVGTKLTAWVERLRPELVVIEKPFFSSRTPAAGELLNRLLGAAGAVLYRKEVESALAEIWDWQAWAKGEGWVKTPGDDGNDAAFILRWWEAGAPKRERKARGRKRAATERLAA